MSKLSPYYAINYSFFPIYFLNQGEVSLMNILHRKLQQATQKKAVLKTTYNEFTFREIADFENSIIEVHELVRKKYEETKNMDYLTVALDCLKAINDMEIIKSQIVLK